MAPSPIARTTRLSLGENLTLQDLGGDDGGVVLNLVSGEMYTLNDTGLAFLRRVDGEATIDAIAAQMLQEYEVEPDVLAADLVDLATALQSEGLVQAS